MSLQLCFYSCFVHKPEHGSAPWQCTRSVGGRSRTCQGHSHTMLSWVRNSGASEGLLALPGAV